MTVITSSGKIEKRGALRCEVLIIGTGAGGASVAAVLAEAGRDVLMVEEGPHVPLDRAPTTLGESMLGLWRGGGLTATLGRPPIAFAEGRCVGGGTEINSAIFQRAPDAVLDSWANASRAGGLRPERLAHYYDRAASMVHASLTDGEAGPPTAILERAGRAMGWQVVTLERARLNGGPSRQRISGFATGTKQSMTLTLIPRALEAGARLLPNCRVLRLKSKGRRVERAEADIVDEEGKRRRVDIGASHVFLCAGTTQTPALLQRSGIGFNAGRSFQLHPTLRMLARFPDKVEAEKHHLSLVAISEFMPDIRFGGSVFTLATFGLSLAEDWATRRAWLPDYNYYATYYVMIRPDGVGSIRALPGLTEPVVGYRLTERDWRRLGQGAKDLASALLAAGALHVVPSIRGHLGWSSRDELDVTPPDNLPRDRAALMSIHLFGSCALGYDPSFHCTDEFGRLYGSDNVVVADGSILPGAPGVNPQATIMAFALYNAEAFLNSRD